MSNNVPVYNTVASAVSSAIKLPYESYQNTPLPISGYLLKEDGFHLLKEDGSRIIL